MNIARIIYPPKVFLRRTFYSAAVFVLLIALILAVILILLILLIVLVLLAVLVILVLVVVLVGHLKSPLKLL